MHWLPVRYRIDFKICLLTFKAIHRYAPSYLCELISVKESQHYSVRSSSELLLRMPSRITKKTLGDRAFQVAAPCLWNSLPGELRRKSDLSFFKGIFIGVSIQLAFKIFILFSQIVIYVFLTFFNFS